MDQNNYICIDDFEPIVVGTCDTSRENILFLFCLVPSLTKCCRCPVNIRVYFWYCAVSSFQFRYHRWLFRKLFGMQNSHGGSELKHTVFEYCSKQSLSMRAKHTVRFNVKQYQSPNRFLPPFVDCIWSYWNADTRLSALQSRFIRYAMF